MNSYDKMSHDELLMYSISSIFKRNKIQLCKDKKYNNIKINFHKKLIKIKNKKNIEECENYINVFLQTMNNKCKNFNSTIFINNIKKTLFDFEKLGNDSNSNIAGSVLIGPKLNLLKLKHEGAIYHELLHLSSLNFKKIIYDPFNEGYTQLLEDRYFNNSKKDYESYILEKNIMNNIEFIFGKDELEKKYFLGDFDNLLFLIQQYITDDKLIILYKKISEIYIFGNQGNLLSKQETVEENLREIYEILLFCFLNKNINNYYILENIYQFKSNFCIELSLKNKNSSVYYNFVTMDEEKFYEIIEQFKNNLNNKKRN